MTARCRPALVGQIFAGSRGSSSRLGSHTSVYLMRSRTRAAFAPHLAPMDVEGGPELWAAEWSKCRADTGRATSDDRHREAPRPVWRGSLGAQCEVFARIVRKQSIDSVASLLGPSSLVGER